MQDQLIVTLDDRPGELVRILALIERRQFVIRSLQSRVGSEPGTATLDIGLMSESRNVRNLAAQLSKLVAVRDVRSLA